MLRRGGQGVLGAEKGRLGALDLRREAWQGTGQEGEAGEGAWCRKGRLEGHWIWRKRKLGRPLGAKKGEGWWVHWMLEKGGLMGRWV